MSLNKVLTVSMLQIHSPPSVANIAEMEMFYSKLQVLMINGQFKYSLDSFYVIHSPLIVTSIAEMAMFCLN